MTISSKVFLERRSGMVSPLDRFQSRMRKHMAARMAKERAKQGNNNAQRLR